MDPNPTTEANASSKSDGATAVLVETPGKPPADVESPPAPSVQTRSADAPPPPPSPAPSSKLEIVRDVIGRWRRKVGETAKTTEDLVGNVWQHLKTGPSFADAAMGVITQGTKVIAEGGYEKIFRETFDTLPEEQLKDSYACYLSTSAGPVRGILYLSTEKIAFSSDNPLSYKDGNKTEWSYYKVLIPLNHLRTVNPSSSKVKPAEKYIQVVSVDDHEFWYMGFVNYESAVKNLQEVMFGRELQP